MSNCKETSIPQVDNSQLPCCEIVNTFCVSHADELPNLGLPENSLVSDILNAIDDNLLDIGSYVSNVSLVGNNLTIVGENSAFSGTIDFSGLQLVVANITDFPTTPQNTSDLTNDGADGTSTYVENDELADVATSGDYADLSNVPVFKVVENEYTNVSAMYVDQGNQTDTFIQYVIDASGFPNTPTIVGDKYFEYLGTTNGDETDYRLLSDEEASPIVNNIAKTSDIPLNDGEDGSSRYVEQDELGTVAFSNDYEDLNNKPSNLSNFTDDIGATDPLISRTLFVHSTEGNDLTATPENSNRPYATLDAAILYNRNNINDIDKIVILDSATYNITEHFRVGENNVRIESQQPTTLNMLIEEVWINTNGSLEIDIPFGTFLFENGVVAGSNGNRPTFSIIAKVITLTGQNSRWGYVINGYLECDVLNYNGSFLVGNFTFGDFTIKARLINSSGGRFGGTPDGSYTYDFDEISCAAGTTLSVRFGNGEAIVNHGSKTGDGNMVFESLATDIFVNYKLGASVSGSGSYFFNGINSDGIISLTGSVDLSGQTLFINNNSSVEKRLRLLNANITCLNLVGNAISTSVGSVYMENSVVNLNDGGVFMKLWRLPAGGAGTVNDTVLEVVGSNYINKDNYILDYDLIENPSGGATITNTPKVNIKNGILYTKGKFDRSWLEIQEEPFNQYFERNKRKEIIISDKYQIINKSLDTSLSYIIDGEITLSTGEYIELPNTGNLTVNGYGLEASKIIKAVSGESIFSSPVGGSGGLQMQGLKLDGGGLSSCFDLTDQTGNNAIEINVVNFENFTNLGELNGYRQFLGTTIGIYGCSDGLTLSGTWNGFKITNTNCFGFGTSGTLFKEGATLLFNDRMYLDVNISLPTGAELLNLDNTNFGSTGLLQISNTYAKLNNTIDASTNTPLLIPNITPDDSKCLWANNLGITNTILMPSGINVGNLNSYADDTAASAGGVEIGEVYINSSSGTLQSRLT